MPSNGKCISIMPDGTVRFFVPKTKSPRKGIKRLPDGTFVRYEKGKGVA